MSLTASQVEEFRRAGHLTVPAVFDPAEMDEAIAEIERWGEEFLAHLPKEQRRWYVDAGVSAREVLRKLDNPHHHRAAIRQLACDARLVQRVERLIGGGVSVCFSQIFFKAPGGGGPKPAHQDNFYFGPRDADSCHRLDRARRGNVRERLHVLRRRHASRAGHSASRAAGRAVQPADPG
jgi:hypothetical protein